MADLMTQNTFGRCAVWEPIFLNSVLKSTFDYRLRRKTCHGMHLVLVLQVQHWKLPPLR